VIRRFRARVHLFSIDKRRLAEADCLLSVELERFTASRWSGVLTNVRPAPPPAGRYLLRLPNGRVRAIDLGPDQVTGCAFIGLGSLPMP
jgi:hypothetical protein